MVVLNTFHNDIRPLKKSFKSERCAQPCAEMARILSAAILRWPDSLIELEKCNRTTRHDEPTQTGSKVNSSINTRITIHFPSDIVNSYNITENFYW